MHFLEDDGRETEDRGENVEKKNIARPIRRLPLRYDMMARTKLCNLTKSPPCGHLKGQQRFPSKREREREREMEKTP